MKAVIGNLKGIFILIIFVVNLAVCFIPVLVLALLKLLPGQWWKDQCTIWLHVVTTLWMRNNLWGLKLLTPFKVEQSGVDLSTLSRRDWYLVIANHQSWVDIAVLYQLFLGKVPFLKFFLKEQLRYVPMMGLAWWALDFPFMKRYSKSYIKKHPQKAGKDVEITKRACAKFKTKPIAIVNFLEGTRFTYEKRDRLNIKYHHLLPPKAGGAAYVLGILGDNMRTVLDVTICYPDQCYRFWDMLCGRLKRVTVHVEEISITDDLIGDYSDIEYRKHFIHWVNELWLEKDKRLTRMKNQQQAGNNT